MMNFVNNLNIILAVIAILAVITKIEAINQFLRLETDSHYRYCDSRELQQFTIYESLFPVLSSAFIFLAFNFGWFSIIVGIAFAFAVDILMLGFIITLIIAHNIFCKLLGKEQKDVEKSYKKDE